MRDERIGFVPVDVGRDLADLRRIVFGEMGASLAMIAPDPENARAVRSYAKAGFRPVKTVYVVDEEPGNTGWELVMLLEREEWERQETASPGDSSLRPE